MDQEAKRIIEKGNASSPNNMATALFEAIVKGMDLFTTLGETDIESEDYKKYLDMQADIEKKMAIIDKNKANGILMHEIDSEGNLLPSKE